MMSKRRHLTYIALLLTVAALAFKATYKHICQFCTITHPEIICVGTNFQIRLIVGTLERKPVIYIALADIFFGYLVNSHFFPNEKLLQTQDI